MTERNISVNFDYVKRTITATLIGPSNSPAYPYYLFRAYDENGVVISNFFISEVNSSAYGDLYVGSSNFGLDLSSFWASYDSSFGRTDLSGVYVGVGTTNWELSSEFDYPAGMVLVNTGVSPETRTPYRTIRDALETGYTTNQLVVLDKRNNQYLNDKLLITRGDAVLQGSIATVTNKNAITLNSSFAPGVAYSNYNLNSSIVEVISGSFSGTTFAVTSHAAGSSTVYVDRDCSSMSGQIIKIMPYREISSYSGWSYSTSGPADNKGSGGILTRFGLTETIPNKLGSIYYSTGVNLGFVTGDHPTAAADITIPNLILNLVPSDPTHPNALALKQYFDPAIDNIYFGLNTGYIYSRVGLIPQDPYKRTVSVGDLVIFNPASNPGSTATGLITNVNYDPNLIIDFWPRVNPATVSSFTIYRNNYVRLDCFPEFDKTYNCAAFPTTGSIQKLETLAFAPIYGSGAVYSNISTPSAELDFSANEYEGAFGNTNFTSHFHIGPVKLSNGQVLDDAQNAGNGVTPYLYFSGLVYHGNPNSPTTVVSRKGFSSQNTNVAGNFDGSYYRDGVMTITSNAAFNASETLICKATVGYGSAKIERVFTIPVQPAV